MHTVFDFAAKRAELAPDAIAFEEVDTGRQLTFAHFNDRAARGAAVLERLGIAQGERVAILCHNCATFFEVLFACGKANSSWCRSTGDRRRPSSTPSSPTAARASSCMMRRPRVSLARSALQAEPS